MQIPFVIVPAPSNRQRNNHDVSLGWKFIWILAAIVAIFQLTVTSAGAQWTKTANQILGTPVLGAAGGAMTYIDGRVWAGYQQLFYSDDSGLTWNAATQFLEAGDAITDLQFYDRNNGLATTFVGTLYRTNDGGSTWEVIYYGAQGSSACFAGSPLNIVFLQFTPGFVAASTNGGTNWTTSTLNNYGRELIYQNGIVYALTSNDNSGTLFRSSDLGLSWSAAPGRFDNDSYMFGFDSCGTHAYLVNEAALDAFDNTSQILRSTDYGDSWVSTISMSPIFFTGSLAISPQAVYVPTAKKGVFRSTDDGANWSSIDGPQCGVDEEYMCAISDNILLAVDYQGSVWRTNNSGGDPLKTLAVGPGSLSTTTLFDTTKINVCSSAFDTVFLHAPTSSRCFPVSIASITLVGSDSGNYSLDHLPSGQLKPIDTLAFGFHPDAGKPFSAQLLLKLTDGELFVVALSGSGVAVPPVILHSQDYSIDTVGEEIDIPIRSTSPPSRNLGLQISYDTSVLVYHGSFAGSTAIDVSSVPGTATIQLGANSTLALDSTLAVAKFAFYPIDGNCTTVSFDSLRFLPASECYTGAGTTSTICASPNCGLPFLSGLLRYGKLPSFRIAPNPASTTIGISLSGSPTADALISVLSVLGTPEETSHYSLSRSKETKIDVSALPSGIHYVRIQSAGRVVTYPIVIQR